MALQHLVMDVATREQLGERVADEFAHTQAALCGGGGNGSGLR